MFAYAWRYETPVVNRDARRSVSPFRGAKFGFSAWRRAAFLDPTIVPAHLALADAYVRLAQPALAVQAVRAGLAALPQSPELLDKLSRLERR